MNRYSVHPDDPSGFVLISDAVPDALLEIRYFSTYNFVGERIDGYEEPVALMTREAARALQAVSLDLKAQGLRLKVYDAYRPQAAVAHFVRWSMTSDISMQGAFYPGLSKEEIFSRGFIARRSSHTRGSTVDLTLLEDATGRELDMGGVFDHFGDRSHYDYPNLTERQRANRALLRTAMTARGFVPISGEWWHFTLKGEPYPDTYFTFPVSSRTLSEQSTD